MKNETFRQALQYERSAVRRQLIDRLVNGSLAAVDTLRVLAEPGNTDTTRLAAAKAMLEFSGRHLTADLIDRLAALEDVSGLVSSP